ncbi:internalin N-terminal domain-containing protein [Listeria ivanovii]|uniref:Internalin N-terminal domain-containing protein n=2 Tax=Listeria ivanovii TaxID=1638 RepID=A0ABS1G7T5_LISIV|nr:internalin N-terminal domain-containing protein [Listeria ivanovii]AIS60761.1 internalin [Listeria ivanovii subsp. londoniensis]AIS63588.1 internalin [Listeria ivanovii subsp. londoniensis]MBK1962795.1 internalin N-terminal domain-containing protein [Listeria ivanovii subsp. londoniensis]MBK1967522.1 internalin N-terminal domain-containing protein [Listeria ivanovii subsp. londoniensis]MBK1985708.1 internalin N-terminal domain-containing protein [Listeria ivanovii subsp. londoniensis]
MRKIIGMLLITMCCVIFTPMTKVQAETVPLPAPIIEAFPVEAIAEVFAEELGKESVNDIITQDDLDTITVIALPGLDLTGEDLNVLNNEVFPNAVELGIWSNNIGEMPSLSASLPSLKNIQANSANITSFPNEVYPNLTTVDMSGNKFGLNIPHFFGMENLIDVNLEDAGLSGFVEKDIWMNLTNLDTLLLYQNHLISIPEEIFQSKQLSSWSFDEQTATYPKTTIKQGENLDVFIPFVYQALDFIAASPRNIIIIRDNGSTLYEPEYPTYEGSYMYTIDTAFLAPGEHLLEISLGYNDGEYLGWYDFPVTITE